MAVTGVTDPTSLYGKTEKTPTTTANSVLTMTDFYELLAAQLKYQDMDNPMSTSEMMSSMVQSQMIQALSNMNAMNTTTYAASMVGKEVTIAETDKNGKYTGEVVGVVSSVILGDNPLVMVNGKSYSLSQIMQISDGSAAEGANDGADPGEGSDPENPSE